MVSPPDRIPDAKQNFLSLYATLSILGVTIIYAVIRCHCMRRYYDAIDDGIAAQTQAIIATQRSTTRHPLQTISRQRSQSIPIPNTLSTASNTHGTTVLI